MSTTSSYIKSLDHFSQYQDIILIYGYKKMVVLRSPHDKQNPFAMINKKGLSDPKLSWGAKGLWAYLLSLPDDWKVTVSHLSKIFNDKGGGEKAIYSFLNELISEGYCERFQNKNDKGLFGETDYYIMEFKKSLPHSPQRDAVEPDAVQAPHTNTNYTKKENNNKEGVVVSSILKDIKDLSEEDKVSLSRIPEERLLLALEFAKIHPPKESLIQLLMWHCNKKEPPIPNPAKAKTDPGENRENALFYEIYGVSKTHTINALNSYVEFTPKAQGQPLCINYDELGYVAKFKEAWERFDFKIQKNKE